ncbi:MAG: hypothetical protein ABMA25_17775 [Ilumatobacteraceae bacterium]
MSLERPDVVEVVPQRLTVVTALPLKAAAREKLAQLLSARVVDIREVVEHVDLVLTPVCSPQTIGMLQQQFDGARIYVVELDDWEFDVDMPGPVKRILRSGADAYVLADSIDELAAKIGRRTAQQDEPAASDPHELPASTTVDDLIAAFLRESVEYSTRVHAEEPEAR